MGWVSHSQLGIDSQRTKNLLEECDDRPCCVNTQIMTKLDGPNDVYQCINKGQKTYNEECHHTIYNDPEYTSNQECAFPFTCLNMMEEFSNRLQIDRGKCMCTRHTQDSHDGLLSSNPNYEPCIAITRGFKPSYLQSLEKNDPSQLMGLNKRCNREWDTCQPGLTCTLTKLVGSVHPYKCICDIDTSKTFLYEAHLEKPGGGCYV